MNPSPFRTLWCALLALMTSLILAGHSHAVGELISAKYRHSNGGDATFSGAAVLGSPGDQWNDIDDNGFNGQAHTFSTIIDSTGATVAGVGFQTLNGYWGGNHWGSGDYNAYNFNVNSGSSPYYNLLRTYFGDLDQQITGLTPGGLYDLVIYLHTHDNRALAIWCNGIVKYGAYDLSGAPLVANRDYMVFSGVAADGSGNIRWYRQDWNEGRWSGFQLRPHLVAPAPTGASGSATIAKNAFKTFATSDFGFASTDPLASFAQAQITALPTHGQLLLSGNPVLLNQIVSATNINSGNLIYQPTTNYTGSDSFPFKVSDGSNYSAAANTYTVTTVAQASLINIQFYRASEGTAFGPGAAVIGAAGNQWNNLDMGTNNGAPHFTSIQDVSGNPTGVTVDFANYPSVNDWSNGDYWTWGEYDVVPAFNVTNGSTPFYGLLRNHVDDPDVTLNGLTPGNYDIFALLHQHENRQQGITLQGASKLSKPYGQNVSTTAGAPLVLNRDYVLFKNFTVAADGKLRINREAYERLMLSGLQIRPATSNAAPTAASGSFLIAKNSYRTFKLAEFGFADADVGDELQAVKIISLPALGQLALNGSPVLLNQLIAQADIKNGYLKYSPAADGTGSPYTNFQFKVSDGVALSASTYTMTANVVPQASLIDIQFYRASDGTAFGPGAAVIGSGGDQWNNLDMGTNDGQYAPHFSSIIDVSGNPTGVTVDFANYPSVNDWSNGDYWTWGQYDVVPAFNVTNGSTPFYGLLRSHVDDPDVTLNGLTPGNYDIFALLHQHENRQQGITLQGASKLSKPYGQNVSTTAGAPLVLNRDYVLFKNFTVAADGKLRINREAYERLMLSGLQIRPATGNAAPTAASGTFAMALNTFRTLKLADFGFSDADVGDELQMVKMTTLPAAGTLYLNGVEVLLNQIIALADIEDGYLKFVPASYATGAGYASIGFQVSDGVAYGTAKTATYDVLNRANLINVQFYKASDGTAFGPGTAVAAGAGTDQWNNLDMGVNNGQYAPHFSTINDVAGNPTGVTVDFANYPSVNDWSNAAYNTYDNFNVNSTSAPVFYDLLRSHVDDPDVTLNGLTPGLYDFIALLHQHEGRQQGITLHYGATTQSKSYGQNSSAGTGAPLVANRDYVIFSGIAVGSDGKLRINRQQDDRLLLSGFQLAQAATPAGGVTGSINATVATAHAITLSELAFASIDYGNTAAKIKITGLPSTGTLKLNSSAVALNQVITLADLAAAKLNFTMASLGTDSFLFQVSNDGGATYSANDTLNITVTATAAPFLISAKYRHTNQSDPTFSGAALLGAAGDKWNDIDDNGHNGQAWTYSPIVDSTNTTVSGVTVQIVNNYWGNNEWGNNDYWAGGTYHVTSSDAHYDLLRSYFGGEPQTKITGLIAGAKYDLVVYLHTHDNRRISVNANGTEVWGSYALPGAPLVIGRDAIVFKGVAADGTGNILFYRQNGDNGLFSGFQLRPHLVAPAPTAAAASTSIAMNSYKVFSTADFGFASTDSLASLAQIKVTVPPAAGQLLLNGNLVLTNQIIPASNISSGNLRFVPATNGTGSPYDTFQFKVSDGTSYSSAYTYTLNVKSALNLVSAKFYKATNGDPTYTGPGAISNGSNLWNNIDFSTVSAYPTFSLTDSNGGTTGVGLRFNQNNWDGNNWGFTEYWTSNGDNGRFYVSAASTPYYDLMRSYIRNVNMTVYGLTPGTYDFYVYLSSQRDSLNQQVRIWANGNGHPGDTNPAYSVMQQLYGPNEVLASSSAPLVVHRDYVKFKNLTVDANGQLNFWWDNGEQALCGFQLAAASSNALPTGADKSLTLASNAYRTFAAADFGFVDTDPGDELQAIKVTTLPAAGSLTLNGNPVLQNQAIAASALSGLRFETSGTGTPYATFQFKVSDGTAYSTTANTMTSNVYPAIAGTNKLNVKFYHAENGNPAYSGAAAVGSVGDAWNNIDATSDGIYAHRVNTLLTDSSGNPTGTGLVFNQANWDWNNWGDDEYWTSNGNNGRFYVSAASTPYYDLMRSYIRNVNMTVYGLTPGTYDFYVYLSSQRDSLNQQVRIWANGNGHPGDTNPAYSVMQQLYGPNEVLASSSAPLVPHRDYVKFKNLTVDANGQLNFWWDNGEQALCGFQLTASSGNALPTGTPATIEMAVNTSHTVSPAEFGFADSDPGDELQAVKITSVPANGSLYLTGWTGPVLVNQIIAPSAITSGALSYVPNTNGTGTSYDSFQFKVSDGKDYSTSANTLAFNVYPKASLVNVKFYHAINGDSPYSGAAAVGAPGDQWNNIDATSDGIYANRVNTLLTSATGAATGVRLAFNQANWEWNTWGSGNYTTSSGTSVTAADPTYDLMRSYIRNCDMTLTGITPGVYDFIVYSVANRNNVNQNTRFWVNGGGGAVSLPTTANLPGSPLVENRDYVVFQAVTVNASGNLRLYWDNGEELLCGFQLKPSFNASFTTDKVGGEAPLEVQFTDTSVDGSGGTITGWSWDFGDGTTSTEQSPIHDYSVWGNFQARLTVTNSNSLSTTSKPTTITVTQPSVIIVSSSNQYASVTVNVGPGTTVVFASGVVSATFGGLTGSGNISLVNADSNCVTLTVGQNNQNETFAGVLSGCGGLTKAGSGTTTLTGNNTYGGKTTITSGKLSVAKTIMTPGVNASYFQGFSGHDKLDLQGAAYTQSATRCFTGSQGLLGLTATTSVTNYMGNMSGYAPFGSISGSHYTGWSGTFTPQGSGDVTYTFYWSNDDRGAMFIDKNGDGVFQAGEQVGTNTWHNEGGVGVTLTAGTHYNFIYMSADGGGGYNNTWSFSGPGLSQRSPNASDTDQAGMWNIVTQGGSGNILPPATELHIDNSSKLELLGGDCTVNRLYLGGAPQTAGTYGSTASAATNMNDTHFSATGVLTVTTSTTAGSDYSTWAALYPGFSATDPTLDPDHDGMTNQQEYAFGLNPSSASSVSPISSGLSIGRQFTYTRRDPALTGLTYQVYYSRDLSTWAVDASAVQTPGAANSLGVQAVSVQLSGAATPVGGKLFVRVVAD